MAFPTIPTVGAGRVLGLNQANTTAVRTFPNLSGLTKNAGDLLIAIVVGYQTSTGTNAAFSGWTAGWTEFHDSATSTTLAIGMAYKWSTGSETGAISVTQAGTITGHASMMLLSIPGAHATTPPEAGSRASGTGASNPASFDPSGWAAEDTLWIAVGGSGEDAISGTWTGMGSAPTNYSGYSDTATPDSSVIGQTELAVAFRQLNASAEDVGTFTANDTSSARDAAVVIAVRPRPPMSTPVAEISLASHATPPARTAHSIKVRARTTSGSGGTIKAALYEGSTNRSGDLTSSALTTSLSEVTLAIPDASAANITDYSNLSLRIWGYDDSGSGLVFEVANVYLQLPAATGGGTTYYGATSLTTTFGEVTAGQRKTFGQTVRPISFGAVIAGQRKTFSQTATSISFGAVVSGNKTATTLYGITQSSIAFGAVVGGQRKAFGQVALPIIFGKDVSGRRRTFSTTVLPILFSKDVRGYRKTFSTTTFPITFASTTAGNRLGITYFGVVARPITFGKDVAGQRRAFSQLAFPITFGKDVAGRRRAFSQIVFPITFGKAALGTEISYGATSLGIIFGKEVAGRRKTFSQSIFPLTFGKDVRGTRKTFSSLAFPINVPIHVVGVTQGNSYGSTSLSVIFGKDVSARRKTFGQLLSPYIFAATTQAKRRTVSQIVLPITFGKDVSGRRRTFGQVARPIGITIVVSGIKSTPAGTHYGVVARPITFAKDVRGYRKTFGQIDFEGDIIFDIETGRIKTYAQSSLPIIITFYTSSHIIADGIVLNLAENVYIGEQQVVAVYTNGQMVWSLV